MEKIHKVVLTGGPSGGKSTLMSVLEEHVPQAYCVQEMATILMSGGFPAPTELHPWNEEWQRNFQIVVAAGQSAMEDIEYDRARQRGKSMMVFDRGIVDGAAYLRDGIKGLEQITGKSERELLGAYDVVLHLSSSAAHNAYDKHSNPHRFEESEQAMELERRTLEAWAHHPNRIILDQTDKAERIYWATNHIVELLK